MNLKIAFRPLESHPLLRLLFGTLSRDADGVSRSPASSIRRCPHNAQARLFLAFAAEQAEICQFRDARSQIVLRYGTADVPDKSSEKCTQRCGDTCIGRAWSSHLRLDSIVSPTNLSGVHLYHAFLASNEARISSQS